MSEQRYEEALKKIVHISAYSSETDAANIGQIAREALNPEPQYEEVEIIAYGTFIGSEKPCKLGEWPTRIEANEASKRVDGSYIVELKGVHKREIKPKVKRREEVLHTGAISTISSEKVPDFPNRKIYAEWEQ